MIRKPKRTEGILKMQIGFFRNILLNLEAVATHIFICFSGIGGLA